MNKKTFTITFEGNDSTKWLYPDENLNDTIRLLMGTIATSQTTGAVPRVTVTQEQPNYTIGVSLSTT